MENIITYEDVIKQHQKEIIEVLEEGKRKVVEDPEAGISEISGPLENKLDELGKELMKKTLEDKEKEIKQSNKRLKEGWTVERKNQKKSIVTVFGEVKYHRTYYSKKVGNDTEYTFLVDDLFGIGRHQRVEPLVEARLVETASDTSYQKSGKQVVKDVDLTATTVMNKVHQLDKLDKKLQEKDKNSDKKEVDVLYIEADEDHISLQNGKNAISKLVYVHEGYKNKVEDKENDKEARSRLKNVHYISGEFKESEEIWLEVADYVDKNYKLDKIEKIFIGGDGDPWIKEGLNWLPNSKFILDKYHLNDRIITATVHEQKYRSKLWSALNILDKSRIKLLFAELITKAKKETRKNRIREARDYIYNQWEGIKNHVEDEDAINPSAEPHVSHILSDRMSSRPMGWSNKGMDKMSKLRAFKFNGGTRKEILELIKERKRNKRKQKIIGKISSQKPSKNSLINKYGEKKENVPALRRGKRDGTYHLMKGLAN